MFNIVETSISLASVRAEQPVYFAQKKSVKSNGHI